MNNSIDVDGFATHQVPLISAVLQTRGPVIEFGAGHYSTPLLHELCHDRMLITIDDSADWLLNFAHLKTELHHLLFCEDGNWEKGAQVIDSMLIVQPSIVFVDQGGQDTVRTVPITHYKGKADLIIVHDSNVEAYNLKPLFDTFKYQFEYTAEVLHTMVLSDVAQFSLNNTTGGKVR